jgi:bisphosphoglycerate-dependent phosphoglycerate mutase
MMFVVRKHKTRTRQPAYFSLNEEDYGILNGYNKRTTATVTKVTVLNLDENKLLT